MTQDRASALHPIDLPVHLTRFIGRGRELDELTGLLGEVRLLTLTGAGGSGKTRLAGEVASRAAADFARVAWVDLAPVDEGGLLAAKVAAAVRAAERPETSPFAWIVDAVGDARVLLVLDNCEHLVEACALLVDGLLRSCPELVVLATSREALGVASETAWLVPPLEGRDAVRLFVERARSALPTFALTKANTGAVEEICRRLDGIPLAIELAAARVRVLSPAQIAGRLDDAFRLLNAGSRTSLARHRTLRATMEWSFALLEEPHQVLLARLGVFSGSFTLDAAEAVCAAPPLSDEEILDGIAALVDKSLLVLETGASEARYRLLETVRQYGVERLAEARELEAFRERHADWFLRVIETAEPRLVGGSSQPGLVEELARDHDNLRAAMTWALADLRNPERALRFVGAAYWFWYALGRFREARRFTDQALALPGTVDPARRGRARVSSALTALAQGDYALACSDFEKALLLLARGGDPFDVAAARAKLGAARLLSGDRDGAEATLEALLGDLEGWAPESMAVIFARFWRGWAAYLRGDLARARILFEANAVVGRDHRLPTTLAHSLVVLARIAFVQGDTGLAVALVAEGLEREVEVGDGWGLALGVDVTAAIAARHGRAEDAVRLLAGVEAHRRRLAIALPGLSPIELEALVSALRETLGDRFEGSWEEGLALTGEALVALARQELERAPARSPVVAHGARPSKPDRQEAAPTGKTTSRIQVSALGPLQVRVDGAAVEPGAWGSARPRELLLYLLVHPEGRTKEQVGLAFWPDASPAQLRNNFHVTLHRLRKAVGQDDVVGFAGDRYRVDPATLEGFDVTVFERAVGAARRALRRREEGAAERIEAAVAPYRGDFLDGEPMGDWLLDHRERLRRTYAEALSALARHHAAEGRHARAAEVCRRLLAHDPLDEGAVRTLMECTAALGDRAEALRVYVRFADRLQEELGTRPAGETARLHEALRKGVVTSA